MKLLIINAALLLLLQYDCYGAPLMGVQESWWNDRNGIARYFWTGLNTNISNSHHTCQCGIDRNCINPNAKCNCDAMAFVRVNDNGKKNKVKLNDQINKS